MQETRKDNKRRQLIALDVVSRMLLNQDTKAFVRQATARWLVFVLGCDDDMVTIAPEKMKFDFEGFAIWKLKIEFQWICETCTI